MAGSHNQPRRLTPVTATASLSPVPFLYSYGMGMTTNILPGGDVSLNLQFTAAPTNDNFAHRTKLTGARTHISANNYAASTEQGEPDRWEIQAAVRSGTPGPPPPRAG